MRWSEAGEISISGYDDVSSFQRGSRAPYLPSRYVDASSTLPDAVFGKTFWNSIASAPPTVLIGMHHQRVVVVNEERLERRRQRALGQVTADVDDVERARALGHEVGPRQTLRRLRERVRRAVDEAAADHAELPGQGRQ